MRNRKTIIIAALICLVFISASIDTAFSLTWSIYKNRFTSSLAFDGAPAITQTNDMKIWVVWEKEVAGNHVIYANVSSDYGASWTEMNLTNILSEDLNIDPSIVQTSNGAIWVVWASLKAYQPPPPELDFNMSASPPSLNIPKGNSDTSIITVTSINNFSDPVDLSARVTALNVTATLNPTQVTPPPNATADSTLTVNVGTEATPGNYSVVVIGKSPNKAHGVSLPLEIPESATSSSNHASNFIEPLSNNSSQLLDTYDIYYKYSNDNGASWSEEIPLTENPADDLAPSILQASNGTLWLVWSSSWSGNYEIFYKTSSDFGASWSNNIQLTSNSTIDARPAIAQAKDGRIWVAWHSDRYGDQEILYKIYDGSSWSSDMRLTDHTNRDTAPAILQTVDDVIWIFWTSSGNEPSSTGDIYYKQSFDNGATWQGSIQFTTDSNEDMWPAVTQTKDTKIWVLWTSNRGDQPDGNFDVWYRTSLAGDVDNDGDVDIFDLATVAQAFGTRPGDLYWNPDADLNKDDKVDIDDLIIVGRNYGST